MMRHAARHAYSGIHCYLLPEQTLQLWKGVTRGSNNNHDSVVVAFRISSPATMGILISD